VPSEANVALGLEIAIVESRAIDNRATATTFPSAALISQAAPASIIIVTSGIVRIAGLLGG